MTTDDFQVHLADPTDSAEAARRSPLRPLGEHTYLLARVALGWHLAGEGVSVPLFLDDVTSHADASRVAPGILEVCGAIAGRRQVVVFAHDEPTLAWARAKVDGGEPAVRPRSS